MPDAKAAKQQSWWIRFVEIFLLWTGGRAVLTIVLLQLDPGYRAALDGPFMLIAEAVYAFLAIGAAVAIHTRYQHALMMATAALAIYTGLAVAGVLETTSDLPGARAAYKASREARGLPVTDEQLDRLFSPDAVPILWAVGAGLCIPPYLILLWRKHELEPLEEVNEDDDS